MNLFKGKCPECENEKSPMFINDMDLLECPSCGLQIMVDMPGVTAILLNEKGSGIKSSNYSNNVSKGEILFKQDLPHFPYTSFKEKVEIYG